MMKARFLEMLKQFALSRLEVKLRSGRMSNIYIDCRQIYYQGEGLFIIGELFFQELLSWEAKHPPFDACGGMAMGGAPLTCAMTLAAFRHGRKLPGVVVRKDAREHGISSGIDGDKCLIEGSRVLLLEDVVTTAQSAIRAIKALRDRGAVIDTLFCLVDREEDGHMNLEKIGISLRALCTLKEIADLA